MLFRVLLYFKIINGCLVFTQQNCITVLSLGRIGDSPQRKPSEALIVSVVHLTWLIKINVREI